MDKNLKKSYQKLNLPYGATEIEIKNRKDELIKALESRKTVKAEQQIKNIEEAYSIIIEDIKKNGLPEEKSHRFESSKESIIGLTITLVIVAVLCYFSCYLFQDYNKLTQETPVASFKPIML